MKSKISTISAISLASIFAYYVSVGVAEEVVFRGFFFEFVKSKAGASVALIYTSIVFGLAHLSNLLFGHDLNTSQAVLAAIIGVIICALYYFFGLSAAVFAHTTINVSAIFLEPSGYAVNVLVFVFALSIASVFYADVISPRFLANKVRPNEST